MAKSELGGHNGAGSALSVHRAFWQSQPFIRARAIVAFVGLGLVCAPVAMAGSLGDPAVMKQGHYVCETPGDAMGPVGIHQPAQDFTILHASVYSAPQGRGTYLLEGNLLRFTSGPRKGQAFRRISENFLRRLDALGQETNLRCIRSVLNNQPIGSNDEVSAPR